MHRPTNGMRPIHPGEILREDYLVPLGMTPNALHVTAGRINDICRERWGVPRRHGAPASVLFRRHR